jgi:hypothetical protein
MESCPKDLAYLDKNNKPQEYTFFKYPRERCSHGLQTTLSTANQEKTAIHLWTT